MTTERICEELVELYRQHQDLQRTQVSLTLRIYAQCRRHTVDETKTLKEMQKDADALVTNLNKARKLAEKNQSPTYMDDVLQHLLLTTDPYFRARQVIDDDMRPLVRKIEKTAATLPVHPWVKSVFGFGDKGLGLIVGAAGRPISDYRTPAAFWKRMGLAVIDGGRQRKVASTEGALKHGYAPHRRALVFSLGDSLFKCQSNGIKNGAEPGPYRVIYDAYKERKQNELLPVCMLCKGEGMVKEESGRNSSKDQYEYDSDSPGGDHVESDVRNRSVSSKSTTCGNCKGTGGPAPWGYSNKHRHLAALRYMEKRLLKDLWREWRKADKVSTAVAA